MKQGLLMLILSIFLTIPIDAHDEWITIFVHGALGVGANASPHTISLMRKDAIEGSSYEANVNAIREHPYVAALSPVGKQGLHTITPHNTFIDAAHVLCELYTDLALSLGGEKSTFYTYGWSGLISNKRRVPEARTFYVALRKLYEEQIKLGNSPKIRLIGYSYGPVMFLNLATIRAEEFPHDTFVIEETILLGTPITLGLHRLISAPPFKKVYNIYSRADKIQRLDAFSGYAMSHRCFKGTIPNLVQIEYKVTAPYLHTKGKTVPSFMRRRANQSFGHVELWSFGWTRHYYRKNLYLYPLCGAVFIPFLLHAARCCSSQHIQVDLRAEQEEARIRSHVCHEQKTIPFIKQTELQQLITKAMSYHPDNEQYRATAVEFQQSLKYH